MTSPTPSATAPAGHSELLSRLSLAIMQKACGVPDYTSAELLPDRIIVEMPELDAAIELAIGEHCRTHSQLLAQNAALISALTAVTHAPENGEFDARLRLAALKRIAADALAKVSP